MSDNILDRLAVKSRAGQEEFNSPKFPSVKLDGSGAGDTAGQILRFDGGEMTNLGDTLKMQIIRVRKKLLLGGETSKFFSEEYDSSARDTVTLKRCDYVDGAWSKPTVVATGTPQDIRQTNDVKVVSVVYAIVGDELVKLTVKGASTTGDDGLYAYLESFKPEHVFQFNTLVSVSKVQKNRAISYHRMHFKRGAEITEGFETVEKYLDIIEGTSQKEVKEVATVKFTVGKPTTDKEDGDDFF